MSFSVIIVLHNSAADIRRLLPSFAHFPALPRVICVDTCSSDGGVAIARDWGADVVELDGNLGFGAANNAGLALVQDPVTVLLNPDCVLLDDSLPRLAGFAAGEQPSALVAPRLLNLDGTPQRSAHPAPGTRAAYTAALIPPRMLPPPLRHHLEPYRAARPRRVGWAIGACLAARTDVLRRLGPFDAEQFLYGEDLDLCLRAAALGVPTVLHPELRVVHAGGHATSTEPFALKAQRRRAVIAANLGSAALRRDDRAQAITFALRAAVGRDRARNRAQLAALREARGISR